MNVQSSHRVVELLIDVSADAKFTTKAIDMRGMSLVSVELPGTWTAADLQVYAVAAEPKPDNPTTANFKALYDSSDTQVAITTPTAGRVYSFVGDKATAIAPCAFIIFRSSADQAADRTLKVMLKS